MPDTTYRSILISRFNRSLSRKAQLLVVLAMTVAAVIVFALLSILVRPAAETAAVAAPETPGVFHPTPQQIASLKTAKIVTASFRTPMAASPSMTTIIPRSSPPIPDG
jgi:hypothetical protein